MGLTEYALICTTAAALIGPTAAVIYNRRKPELDAAQTESALVNSDSVKATIKRMSDETNATRDLRLWDLEKYIDELRPWFGEVRDTFDAVCRLLKEDRATLGKDMPEIHLSDPPAPPAPRPFPKA